MKQSIMTDLLLISKNPMLAEFMSSEEYNLSWYNDNLRDCTDLDVADVIIYDSFTYGMKLLKSNIFKNRPLIIIDSYKEDCFVSWLTDENKRGYLLIDNFLEELTEAIACVKEGGNYVTSKIGYAMG